MISYLRGAVQSGCALGAVVMLGLAMAMPIAAQAEQTAPMRSAAAAHSEAFGWKNVSASVDRQIQKTQSSVRQIYAQLNRDAPMGGDGLLSLSRRAEQTLTAAQTIQTQVTSYRSIYESYLGVVGEKPVEGESADITDQRKRTQDNLQDIKSALTQSKLLELQARQLQIEIQRRNTQLHQALLSEQIDSPLTPAFWSALTDELPNDKRAFAAPSDNGYGGPLYRWPYFLAALGVTFLVLVTATRPLYLLLRKGQTRIMNRFGQHEEASTSTIPIVINGFLCAILAAIVWEILSLVLGFASESGTAFMQGMVGSLPICGFVIGAGLPLLSRATLRNRTTPDVPRALRGSDWNIALIVLVQNVLLVLSQENIFGLTTQRLLEAIFALIVSTLFVATCRRLNRATDREDIRLAPAVRGIGALLMLTSWVAVALGYVAFAFTTVSWCVSIGVGIAVLTLMSMCLKELTTRLLSPGTRIATRLSALGVSPSHVAQAGVLISGIGNVVMLVILIAIALSDGKFDLPTIAARLHALFIGQSVNGVQVSLNKVVICIGILIAAYYGIRQISRWLDQQLFPTTRLDLGAQNSIRNIFTYVAWIGVFLVVLSEAGLTVKNLTWVVSALSVGIGFGLQSIVQNFVSGIILLAERPIRVGDSVEISGKTGDVKRISVRSTDIGLPDGSTLIVPNSQFITSPVRNATLGGAQGAVATSVTISPRANALLAQDLLAKMMASRTDLLATPAPGVAISAITELGTTLALSGRVGSARDVGGVTNAIMRDAYATLQAAGIELGKPS